MLASPRDCLCLWQSNGSSNEWRGSGTIRLADVVVVVAVVVQVLAAYSESFLAPSVVKNEVLPIVKQVRTGQSTSPPPVLSPPFSLLG